MARNVLFVDHAPAVGGAEQSLLLLLPRLAGSGYKPHLAATGGPLVEKARALGIPVHVCRLPRLRRSPLFPLYWLSGVREVAQLGRHLDAALIVGNTIRASLFAAPAARLSGAPFVWYMRDFWLSESRPRFLWLDRWGKRFLTRMATRIITNSQATAAHLPCRDKAQVVYNGIAVASFDPALSGLPFRNQYGIPADAPLVGMVGRLRPWKGQERFLQVMARVSAAVPDAWFAVVGGAIFNEEDAYRQRLSALAQEVGIAGRVIFTGQLSDPRPALAAMDIFVHPGDAEPFGLVNVEAMAMACPIVAFAHGALPEIVKDGQTGLLPAPGDEAGMAHAIIDLLQDSQRRQVMGHQGWERAQARFNIDRTVAGVIAVFNEF